MTKHGNLAELRHALAGSAVRWLGTSADPIRFWRNVRRGSTLLLALITMLLVLGGTFSAAEEQIRNVRNALTHHEASGRIHIIEIDAESFHRIPQWPWPRSVYARLLDRLSDAGVSQVVFDVDFSSRSQPHEDNALARAIARFPGTTVLPTFRQRGRDGAEHFVENLPIPELRKHAFLGSVNVFPDKDGAIRFGSYGLVTDGAVRPSLPALLANATGKADTLFRINGAIDPDTIPRHSFAELLENDRALRGLRGKSVIVGATAIEMGDRYATPRHGVLPGVVIQAMAAETLAAGLVIPEWGPLPVLVGVSVILLWGAGRAASSRRRPWLMPVLVVSLFAAALLCERLGLGYADLAPALFLCGTVILLRTGIALTETAIHARLTNDRFGLRNFRSLAEQLAKEGVDRIAVARLAELDKIVSLLSSEDLRALIDGITARLSMVSGGGAIFTDGAHHFAWTLRATGERPEDIFAALSQIFRAPLTLGDRSVVFKVNFGIAQADIGDPEGVISWAVQAASEAARRNCNWLEFSLSMVAEQRTANILVADVEAAIARGDFWLAYQPKHDLRRQAIGGGEALVRWQHPVLGALSPATFIPVLEESRRLSDLTLHVLKLVIADLADFSRRGIELSIAVNVSADLLVDREFLSSALVLLDRNPEHAMNIVFEVTESAMVQETNEAIESLQRFVDRGARISIDDYGTGLSTLSYLKKFPASEIKIDQSFVRNLVESRNDQVLVRSTIDLAHELGFLVVAEGVETWACCEMLRTFGCDYVQGWLIGRPMPVDDLVAFVRPPEQDMREKTVI